MEPESRLKSFSRPTFLADEMLGRLAKWLRLLGYDTKYVRGIPDSDLLDIAESEDRVVSREFTGVGSFTNFKCSENNGATEGRIITENIFSYMATIGAIS